MRYKLTIDRVENNPDYEKDERRGMFNPQLSQQFLITNVLSAEVEEKDFKKILSATIETMTEKIK